MTSSFSEFVRQIIEGEDKVYRGRSIAITLEALKEEGNKGITYRNFDAKFRLPARIKDLRDIGHNIITDREYFTKDNWYARYVLVGDR